MTLPWAHTWRQPHLGKWCAICREPITSPAVGIVELWLGQLMAPVHVECAAHEAMRTPTQSEAQVVQS